MPSGTPGCAWHALVISNLILKRNPNWFPSLCQEQPCLIQWQPSPRMFTWQLIHQPFPAITLSLTSPCPRQRSYSPVSSLANCQQTLNFFNQRLKANKDGHADSLLRPYLWGTLQYGWRHQGTGKGPGAACIVGVRRQPCLWGFDWQLALPQWPEKWFFFFSIDHTLRPSGKGEAAAACISRQFNPPSHRWEAAHGR